MTSPTGNNGLTLIEVLVSVALIAIGTVVVMQALANVAQAQAIAEDRAQAYLVVSAKMVEAELAAAGGAPLPEHAGGQMRMGPQPFAWALSTAATEDDPQVHAVEVAISWHRGQQTYRRAIEALVRVPKESR